MGRRTCVHGVDDGEALLAHVPVRERHDVVHPVAREFLPVGIQRFSILRLEHAECIRRNLRPPGSWSRQRCTESKWVLGVVATAAIDVSTEHHGVGHDQAPDTRRS